MQGCCEVTVTTMTDLSTTALLANQHESDRETYTTQSGTCCFCGRRVEGVPVDEAVSHQYFSDYARMADDTGHVCCDCALCMDQRALKQGHWIVTAETHERVSTGDLHDRFESLRDGEYDPPIAIHVSKNPIRSEHAYLWTPVNEQLARPAVSYDRQCTTLDWSVYETVLTLVEELRWYGFRGDDIRSGEPRVSDLESIGADRFREVEEMIEPHRGTALLEIAWTVSRSRDDQPTPPTPTDE